MPRRYPPEFRRKVLDLLKSGRTVAEVAAGLDVTEQTIDNWRSQELIDTVSPNTMVQTDHGSDGQARGATGTDPNNGGLRWHERKKHDSK